MSRVRREPRLFDRDGREVLVNMKCPACGRMLPFSEFGIRRMKDGMLRNVPWCAECRGSIVAPRESRPKQAQLALVEEDNHDP